MPAETDSLLPLPPAALHVLLSLAEGERHGYAIKKDVLRMTAGKVNLGPGTLYGTIKKLADAGVIEESGERPDFALDDERRTYYKLTRFGQKVLAAEIERMRDLVRVAEARGAVRAPRTA